MPGMIETVLRLNKWLCDLDDFNPDQVQELIANENISVLEAAEALGAIDAIAPDRQEGMREFLQSIPPACSAAAFAAVRNALERGLRVQLTWQPAAAFEVRVWDVSDDQQQRGMVNVFVLSPDPDASAPSG
ncbi:MAG: hypothetical protein ACRD0V_14570 [Acidimicrobiales bacterium]